MSAPAAWSLQPYGLRVWGGVRAQSAGSVIDGQAQRLARGVRVSAGGGPFHS